MSQMFEGQSFIFDGSVEVDMSSTCSQPTNNK